MEKADLDALQQTVKSLFSSIAYMSSILVITLRFILLGWSLIARREISLLMVGRG